MDQLKSKAENTDREFDEFKKQQQEEYNKLREHIMLLSAGNSQSYWCSEHVVCLLFRCEILAAWYVNSVSGLLLS